MKSILFMSALLLSLSVFAKNRVLFTLPGAPKKLPDLYMLSDFKRGQQAKKFIESEVAVYVTSEEFIAYIKDGNLFIIKDFESLTKINVAGHVVSLHINNGNLFYEVVLDGQVTLWAINNFKELKAFDVITGYGSFTLDQ